MIHRVYSSLASFKTLEFRSGLNILLAQKQPDATERQTRNRAGKTSLVEVIHFLTGGQASKDSLFRSPALLEQTFGMVFDLSTERVSVERSGNTPSTIRASGLGSSVATTLTNTEWKSLLGQRVFGLPEATDEGLRVPTFRSLFAYFVRNEHNHAFTSPVKQSDQQRTGDLQMAVLFLLGLDWKIGSEWQLIRERETTLSSLRKAAKKGAFGQLVGRASDLLTRLTIEEARLEKMKGQMATFHVFPRYSELEAEADVLTRQINGLANANVVDVGAISAIEKALESETPPSLDALLGLYDEAGIILPTLITRRYEQVHAFHDSVIRNRRAYLAAELQAAKERIASREVDKQRIDSRRAEVMGILSKHGALEHYSEMQAEVVHQEALVDDLRQRYSSAEQLEGGKNELMIERNRLAVRLRADLAERTDYVREAILAFEEVSKLLYESAGSMTVDVTDSGPVFSFPMQGSGSKGIGNMQIFCFDMMLMHLCSQRGIGPGFLVHDSHLFDGVDGRQVVSALKVGAEMAERLDFQYIVTMNEDDAYKETVEGFVVNDHTLPVVLTDAEDDGGLFGIRF